LSTARDIQEFSAVVEGAKGKHMRINRPDFFIFVCANLLFGFLPCLAQPYTSAPIPTAALSYAVEDIIKLSHAGISETVIINFIETSGTLYDLKPRDLIHLRDEGVTDLVINAMIDQRRKFQANAATPVEGAPEVQPQPVPQYTANPCPLNCNLCGSPLVSCRGPISTLYVIPYPTPQRTYGSYQGWGSYHYYGPWQWQRPFHGPRLYRCGHWHGCSHYR
jgi:hypothetical protein